SFTQWGLSSADADAYLATPGVTYTPGANGLKQIGLQKWIALFTQGSEAWAEYRRTGNPASLVPGPSAILTQIPRRIPYSVDEQSVNAASRAAAVARQGPDNFLTRVYWDKP
ncbi:MAG: SusD/RagB family nutrient-binding outer membrane lipoprotein, partial [Gemmatimonadaceae bacterium]